MKKSNRGVTLIELVVVLAIMGILVGGISHGIVLFSRGLELVNRQVTFMQDVSTITALFEADVKTIQLDANNHPVISNASTALFSFTRTDGSNITYQFVGTEIHRNGININRLPIVAGTTGFSFLGYDLNGNEINANGLTGQVRLVIFDFELDDNGTTQSYTQTFALNYQ